MEFISTQKFLRISPKKARVVVFAIKKLTPAQALSVLPFVGKKAAEPLAKVIKTAIANAKQKEVSPETLVFKEIQIGEATRLKRGRAGGRGRWKPYKRRMSHIRVVLETKAKKEEKSNGTKS